MKDLQNSVSQYFPNDQYMMLQNQAGVIKKFKVQNRSLDLNIIEYKTFTAKFSDSTLKPSFKKVAFVKFWHNIREDYSHLSKQVIKIVLSFPITDFCDAVFSSYTSTKAIYIIKVCYIKVS